MSALRSIVAALENITEPVVLATVVRITGSSYGGVGTRMIIRSDKQPIGIVSGGCLEADLAEHAKKVHESHTPQLVTYDTRADDDAAWGLGLGCNGLIDVLLEPLTVTEARDVGQLLERGLSAASRSVLATVIDGDSRLPTGAQALFVEDEILSSQMTDRSLLATMQQDSAEAFPEARRGLVKQYGSATVAFEVITPSIKLVICGSGPDVVPLVEIGAQLGYDLTVVDHRPIEQAHPERFPGAKIVECHTPLGLAASAPLTPHTAAVTMSHNYGRDLDYVRALIASDVAYIGILGPRARTERMLADIAAAGETVTGGDRIYSPVGIDIGSDGPDSIALSILAEVSAVVNARTAGHLRDRRGPMHPSPANEVAAKR